ncbi:MAG TPA: hypothetical protein VL357_00540 [Rariglobus sp.]|jgi:hypothetical protein|nr:hypothetical protein [Rariglobus sp.]
MASLTKTERALRGPGIFEITLGVVMSIMLGVVLAAVYLILKPVAAVKELPKEPVIGAVYFLQGETNSSKATQWKRKRQMLSEGGTADISFSEEELNAWIASVVPQAPVAPKAAPAKADAKPVASGPLVVMDRPNFRIRDGVLQVGVPTTINAFGVSTSLIFQTRGHFSKGQNGYVFVADELYVGSLPTQLVPGLKNLIVSRLMAAEEIPDDLRTAWGKLSLVTVEGNQLRLSLP